MLTVNGLRSILTAAIGLKAGAYVDALQAHSGTGRKALVSLSETTPSRTFFAALTRCAMLASTIRKLACGYRSRLLKTARGGPRLTRCGSKAALVKLPLGKCSNTSRSANDGYSR